MIILFLFLCIVLCQAQFVPNRFCDCLSVNTTRSIRGICALTIVLHHLAQEIDTFSPFCIVFKPLGFLAVPIFFFYSGYGLMKSHQCKTDYAKTFLVKRICSILVPYICMILLYWLFETLMGEVYSPIQVLQSLYNGHPIVRDSWYVITILVFYFAFYWLMRLFRQNYTGIVLGSVLFYIAWIFFARAMNYESYWYNTAICFCFGLWAAVYEFRLVDFLRRHYLSAWIVAFPLFMIFLFLAFFIRLSPVPQLLVRYVCVVSFLVVVLLTSLKFCSNNKLLDFFSDISLELYLCHRLFIRLLRSQFLFVESEPLWILLVVLLSCVFAVVLHKLFRRMNGCIQKMLLQAS